jgi:hypothetical protein
MQMSDFLTADEAKQIHKDVSKALRRAHEQHKNRDRSSIAEVENPNRQVRKSDCEKAISGLHSKHESRRELAKAAVASTNASAAIAALHSDRSLAGRAVSGNAGLVTRLAGAVSEAIKKDYSSAVEARREIKKLLADEPRPRNHEVVRKANAKSGLATLTIRKGNPYPFIIEVDGLYHSEHNDADAAERAFLVLVGGSD